MRSGIFTATESSCIAVIYALLVTLLVYRTLSWSEFVHATMGAVRTTAMVLLIIGMAGRLRLADGLSQGAAADRRPAWTRSRENPLIILLMINVILLLLGTFMDMGAADHHHHADLPAGGHRPSASIRCISA